MVTILRLLIGALRDTFHKLLHGIILPERIGRSLGQRSAVQSR
jgi:hypothetical protein